MQKLSLDEVTALLGIPTESIFNHIKKKRLPASVMKNKGEGIYVFEFDDVKEFATEYLGIELSEPEGVIKMSGMFFEDEYEEKTQNKEEQKRSEPSKKASPRVSSDEGAEVLKELIQELKGDYNDAMKQLTEYKEQAAFQIGQLKSQLENSQKMLTSGQKEMEEKEGMIRKLKLKLKDMQDELEGEKKVLDRMSLMQRIFKIKR